MDRSLEEKLNQYGLTAKEWDAAVKIGCSLHNELLSEPEGEHWYDGQSLSIMEHLSEAVNVRSRLSPVKYVCENCDTSREHHNPECQQPDWRPLNPSGLQGEELPELDVVTDEDREEALKEFEVLFGPVTMYIHECHVQEIAANKCGARQLRAALAEIGRLKGERDASTKAVSEVQDAIAACPALKEWGRCEVHFVSSQIRGILNMYVDAVRLIGLLDKERNEANSALSASRADALKLRQSLRLHAIHMSYDSPGDVPEPCGLWCELCSEHVEDDRIAGHKYDCLLSETPILARREK